MRAFRGYAHGVGGGTRPRPCWVGAGTAAARFGLPAASRAYTGRMAQQRVLGLQARGVEADAAQHEIKGSTTIVELLRMFPNGEAGRLMAQLSLPCAHCGGAFHEPLTMAAKRHRRDPRVVLDAFRALAGGGPTDEQVAAAAKRVEQP
jgi:hypothetical protein